MTRSGQHHEDSKTGERKEDVNLAANLDQRIKRKVHD